MLCYVMLYNSVYRHCYIMCYC